jgi:hypothetical protein
VSPPVPVSSRSLTLRSSSVAIEVTTTVANEIANLSAV